MAYTRVYVGDKSVKEIASALNKAAKPGDVTPSVKPDRHSEGHICVNCSPSDLSLSQRRVLGL